MFIYMINCHLCWLFLVLPAQDKSIDTCLIIRIDLFHKWRALIVVLLFKTDGN